MWRGSSETNRDEESAQDSDTRLGSMEMIHPDDRPSHKVHTLADDVMAIEERCHWLEGRNEWLTSKLLKSKTDFVQRALLNSSGMKLKTCFSGWQHGLNELRMDRHLEDVNSSLIKYHSIIEKFGEEIDKERTSREEAEAKQAEAQREHDRIANENATLQRQAKADAERAAIIERRIQEAETSLSRVRSDAENVIEAAKQYEAVRAQLEREAKVDNRAPRAPIKPGGMRMALEGPQTAARPAGKDVSMDELSKRRATAPQQASEIARVQAPGSGPLAITNGATVVSSAPPPITTYSAAPVMRAESNGSGAGNREQSAERRLIAPPEDGRQVMVRSNSDFAVRQARPMSMVGPPGTGTPLMRPPLTPPSMSMAGQMRSVTPPRLPPPQGGFVAGRPGGGLSPPIGLQAPYPMGRPGG